MRIPSSTAAALLTLGWLVSSTLPAAAVDLTSPDGTIKVQFTTNASGDLIYAVSSDGKPRLEPARAGLTVAGRDLGTGVELGEPVLRRISETFPWRGNKTLATNHCVAAEIPIRSKAGGPEWTLEVRVFDDGVGFRYRRARHRSAPGERRTHRLAPSPGHHGLAADEHRRLRRQLPLGRRRSVPLETKAGDRIHPTHIGPPMTVVYPDGAFGLITEAALYRYSGLDAAAARRGQIPRRFRGRSQGLDPRRRDPFAVAGVRVRARSARAGQQRLIAALCDPPDPELFPDGMNTAWIRGGKAPCTWMVFGNDGAQWDKQKWFVDVSAAIGCEFLLVDAGWRSERWGWLKDGGNVWARAAELCQYAADRGVGIVLWHAYPRAATTARA
jgi:alpha-glucosidase